jgi:hypothetical protein
MTEVHFDVSPFSWQFWPLRVQWVPEIYPQPARWRFVKVGPFTLRWAAVVEEYLRSPTR